MEIDDADRRILRILQSDSSLPLEEIGARAGLSRNACWRRIRAMEAAGVVRGRVALIDPSAVGCPLTAFIHLRAPHPSPDWVKTLAEVTAPMPEILSVYRLSGDLGFLLKAQIAGMAAYDSLYQTLISRVDLAEISASFVLENLKDSTALPV
ncbi:Lrp/AsnC family transcriptional regulator [Fluviibacterium sp. DFM31]|uniref:Lrp/AsnC family transcriptional regulator n=1 Tax=Meridianimarinicoccus marinus TaxID=3231483 RepID=A0ABV3LB26_9RHOB